MSAPEGPALLEVEGVGKHFRGVVALDAVSMTAQDGEIVGIIGPNGAGKTTLFNVVAGTFAPSSGRVVFGGKDITKMPPHRRCRLGIGRTFQMIQPFPSLTAVDNLAVAASAAGAGRRRSRERATQMLRDLDMTALTNRRGADLNAVEGKRLELARALCTDPRLVLLDEIFSGLNDEEVNGLAATVRRLPAQGVTVILIEHNMSAIRLISDRVVAISAGNVIAQGDPDVVLHHPSVLETYLGVATSA